MFASSDRYAYNIQYDDGDIEKGVQPAFVRPFEPYKVRDHVQVRVSKEDFASGTVVSVISEELFDVELDGTGEFLPGVPIRKMRRVDHTQRQRWPKLHTWGRMARPDHPAGISMEAMPEGLQRRRGRILPCDKRWGKDH